MQRPSPRRARPRGAGRARHPLTEESGLSLVEVLIVMAVIVILGVIFAMTISSKLEKARLARCFSDLRSIQSTMYLEIALGGVPPPPDVFWQSRWHGRPPGPYEYIADIEDPNMGHGNDLDGFDEGNPGNAPRQEMDIKFVILCEHDHGTLGRYVYIVDEQAPRMAVPGDDPNYDRFLNGGAGGGGGGTGSGGDTGTGGSGGTGGDTSSPGPGNSGGGSSGGGNTGGGSSNAGGKKK